MSLDYFKKYIKTDNKVTNKNKEIWCYTRVSTKEQSNNNSLTDQEGAIEQFARDNDYIITEKHGGTYESASGDFTRKEFTKLINKVKTTNKKPFAIAIKFMSRFSRSGGNAIGIVSELVEELGVHLIETSSGLSTIDERDRLDVYSKLIESKVENLNKLERTIPGMKTFVKNGNWLGKSPRGYTTHGSRVTNSKHLAATQKIVIDEEGKLLKKAWKWKLEGDQDFVIRKKLETLGLKISKQTMSAMWRNPFYAGISTHKFLEGQAIKGKWKPMISPIEFKKINDALDGRNKGYKQSKYPDGRPLLHSLLCGNCNRKMTGYMAKGKYPYYKCQNSKCATKDMNANTTPKSLRKGLNDIFNEYLSNYALDSNFQSAFKEQMRLTIKQLDNEQEDEHKIITKRISETKTKLDSLKEKYVFEGFPLESYNEFKIPLEKEIAKLNEELSNINSKISNQDKKIEDCVEVAKNISKYWSSGSMHTKTRIQKLVFPEGVVINPKNRQYRTSKINMIFSKNSVIPRDARWEIKNPSAISSDGSYLVAGTGLEPVTFGL